MQLLGKIAGIAGTIFTAWGCTTVELQTDIVVSDGVVAFYFRELERPDCECSTGNFPAPGECAQNSDIVGCNCEPGPAACLDRVSVLRKSKIVSTVDLAGDFAPAYGVAHISFESEIDELLIDGCHGRSRIGVPSGPHPTPTIQAAVAENDRDLALTWTTDLDADAAITSTGPGLGSSWCNGPNDGMKTVAFGINQTGYQATVRTVRLVKRPTPHGTMRLWLGNDDSALRFTPSPMP